MDKKTAYYAYYYSTVDDVTQAQLRSSLELPSVDVAAVQQRMAENGIDAIVQGDPDYHRRVQTAPQAPYVLYYQGSLSVLEKPTLAIVGPRLMSPYAQEVLEALFEQLQYFDVVTVSGMAPGVDTLCHELSLKYNIPTISVLGGGFQRFLRSEKRTLMERIIMGGGLIVSQYKHAFSPTNRSFPQRNRIIASLADTIFLPEAKEKSGSLITADIGYDLQKPVLAPMNSIFLESSRGTNTYIADGRITPLADLGSFLEKHYKRAHQQNKNERAESKDMFVGLNNEEKKIVAVMKEQSEMLMTELSQKCGYSSQELLIHLSMLEMKGVVVQKGPSMYGLIHKK